MPPKMPPVPVMSKPSGSRPWEGQRVLIVDDSPGVREQLQKIYEAVGMQVVGLAINGVDAMQQLESANPDLISLDIIMPEMDGIECYKKIQATGRNIKCVMISWIGGDVSTVTNLSKIIPSHLFQAKPVAAHDLISRLEKVYGIVAPDASINEGPKAKSEDDFDLAFSALKVKIS